MSADWSIDGPNILSPEQLHTVRLALEQSFVILEHRFYNGSRSPMVTVFDDFKVFDEYPCECAAGGFDLVLALR